MLRKLRSIRAKNRAEKQKLEVEQSIRHYLANGREPWSTGYQNYKVKHIEDSLRNEKLLEGLRNNGSLPKNFGHGLDERSVEYPWVFSRISRSSKRILDAGSTFNFPFIINHPLLIDKEVSIYTYYPETNNFIDKRVSYQFGDLRELPYRDNWFDEVICISTIEHIDMDNSLYGYDLDKSEKNRKSYDYLKVISEIRRVLKSRGQLLLTFPFGRYEYHEFFQQIDSEMLSKLKGALAAHGDLEVSFYQYSNNQWNLSTEEQCVDSTSYNPHTGKGKGTDGAAHSRAICTLRFVKA